MEVLREEEIGLADELLGALEGLGSPIVGGGGGGQGGGVICRLLETETGLDGGRQRKRMDESDDYLEDIASSNNNGDGKIGGIPSKFLDLSHFPHLQKSFPGAAGGGDADHHQQHRRGISGNVFSPEVAEEGGMWDIGKKRQHRPIKKL